MRRLLISSVLAVAALAALATTASAAAPVITSFSPAQVHVGQILVINGKNFRKGVRNNRVFFTRASDGKTVRTRPSKANSSRRMEVVVPSSVTAFLSLVNGVAVPTRFQLSVLSGSFSKKTAKSRSPIVVPGAAPTTTTPGTAPTTTTLTTTTTILTSGGTTTTTTAPPLPDCDGDGTPDVTDTDDDNDGLSDDTEAAIHTNRCNKDTDGDGVEDGFEFYSARDLNGNSFPYPGSKPFPNPLDGTDAAKDYDGDGMTNAEEFAAWNLYGGRVLPTASGQSFPYSAGNQTSTAPAGIGAMDLDGNGRITDEEKDADGDKLPNWVEMAKGDDPPVAPCAFTPSTGPAPVHYANIFTDCGTGGGAMPNGQTFGDVESKTSAGTPPPAYDFANNLDYLNPDSDGDGITDGDDDLDYDGVSNIEEITAGFDTYYTSPIDPCDPSTDASTCPTHPSHL
jgi:hypothetical protein